MDFSIKNFAISLLLVCNAAMLVACGSGSSGNGSESEPPEESNVQLEPIQLEPIPLEPIVSDSTLQTGYLLDSAVEGITYRRTDGFVGKTNTDGAFDFYFGDTIEFTIGTLSLGSRKIGLENTINLVLGDIIVTPLSLTPGADNSDEPTVINKLIFLQTLDDDGKPENGIKISEAVYQAVEHSNIDFSQSTEAFISGEFAALVAHLNKVAAFSDNVPREIRSEIDALRHFGNVNLSFRNIKPSTSTFKAWWREVNTCTEIGESSLTITNKSVTFCPNVRGHDGCYDGVIRSNGDITLPAMTANAICAQTEPGSDQYNFLNCNGAEYTTLLAELRYVDGEITGNYEASCNNATLNGTQTVSAAFGKTNQTSEFSIDGTTYLYSYLNQVRTDLAEIVAAGSCTTDDDCEVMTLNESINCSLPEYLAHPSNGIDRDNLSLKQHIFNELKRDITLSQSGSGSSICFIGPKPNAICSNNACQLAQ